MNKNTPVIRSVTARALVTPMSCPVRNAFGVIDVAPLLLIVVASDQGNTGSSYLFAYIKVTL
jgi:mandelate racemase